MKRWIAIGAAAAAIAALFYRWWSRRREPEEFGAIESEKPAVKAA